VTEYKEPSGQHIKEGTSDKFKGSLLFASKNSFDFVATSRRDDLISLCYLLIYLVDENQLGFIKEVEGLSKKKKFKLIKNVKASITPRELCGTAAKNPETYRLEDFITEVMSIKFDEVPPYSKLRFLLTRALLDSGTLPNKEYDWTKLLPAAVQ
jgi:hypothetical protein